MARSTAAKIPFISLSAEHRALQKPMLAALAKVLAKGQFILGPETQALEKEVAALCGARYGVGLNSGTDALVLAFKALNLGPGDEVIVPDFTFLATASAVLLAGATPVLVEVDPQTFCLSPAAVEKSLTPRTKALVPVHLYGRAADMTALMALARKHRLAVVEDACQALGASWQERPVGALGDIGCFSFFPTKNLGGIGDGGMAVTNNADLAESLKRLRNHGSVEKYYHVELGYNSRLAEVQAAVLRVKLPRLKAWNAKRRSLAAGYRRLLRGTSVTLPQDAPGHVYHQFAIRLEERDALRSYLQAQGIETAVHYPLALHQQPVLKHLPSAKHAFPVSEKMARTVLCLPVSPTLTLAQAGRVARSIMAFYQTMRPDALLKTKR